MAKQLEPGNRRELVKLACFALATVAAGGLFLGSPALSLPTLCAVVLATLFSPWVAALERRGLSRSGAILVLLLAFSCGGAAGGLVIARHWQTEWSRIQEKAPVYFSNSVADLSGLDLRLKSTYPFLKGINMAESFSNWGARTESWFGDRLPGLASDFLSCLFLVPILTFLFLREGRAIRRRFFQLVPNRYFESVYIVTHGVGSALSTYLRAKMIEGILVGTITGLGLWAIHSPYAIVLGIWAGVMNVLPYIGPALGALPGIAIAALDAHGGSGAVWMTAAVYGGANLIDSMVIFPGVVAKLVKLPPLVLIASVVLGQHYGGIIGMLVSIPIAAALKVMLSELYVIIYGFVPEG